MWLLLIWLVGLTKLLYHLVLTLPILSLYLFYKLFGASSKYRENLLTVDQQQRLANFQLGRREFTNQVREKMQFVMQRGARALRPPAPTNQSEIVRSNSERAAKGAAMRFLYLASLLVVGLVCANNWPLAAHGLEQDAEILKPVAGLAKSVIKTATLGEPLEVNFDPSGLVKNFAYFTWRTGFPVSMPRGFMPKVQDFYNRVKFRVDYTDVSEVKRKSLLELKTDLDQIIDSIVEEVRQSPDGLYTDYLKTRINGAPLEDACTAVGVQLKAYGVDLTNYRNIAGMVLGIPVMPTVASTMVNVANLASLDAMRDLTQTFRPLNSTALFFTQLPGNALHSVSSVSNSALNSLGNLGQQLPVQNLVPSVATAPLNMFRQQPALAR